MRPALARMAKGVGLAAFLASPFLVHLSLRAGWPVVVPALLAGLQLLVLVRVFLTGTGVKGQGLIALAAGVGIAGLVWRYGAGGLSLSAGLAHATTHLFLLSVFGASLRPGREPMITRIARRVRVSMPEEVVRYTRRVTWVWCGFFAGHLVCSAILLMIAPQTWLFFVNVLNLPSVLLLFGVEYAYHVVRFRHLPKSRLRDILRASRNVRAKAPEIGRVSCRAGSKAETPPFDRPGNNDHATAFHS